MAKNPMNIASHPESESTSTTASISATRSPMSSSPHTGLCPCSHVQAMRRAHLLDGAVPSYRADWEPAAASGRRALVVPWGCPAVLWGLSTANRTCIYLMEPPYFEKLADFSLCMWICGGLTPCGPSAHLATKRAFFGIKTCRLAILLIMQQEIAVFSKF